MDVMKNIFGFIYAFFNINITLFDGYTITLFQVYVYGLVASIVLYIFFRLTR